MLTRSLHGFSIVGAGRESIGGGIGVGHGGAEYGLELMGRRCCPVCLVEERIECDVGEVKVGSTFGGEDGLAGAAVPNNRSPAHRAGLGFVRVMKRFGSSRTALVQAGGK